MIDFNSSLHHTTFAAAQPVKQAISVDKASHKIAEANGSNSLLPKGYKDVVFKENKDVIVQIPIDLKDYQKMGRVAVNDISERAGKKGQFLNWIEVLPKNQLQNVDKLYGMAEDAKKGGYTDLVVLGIGGSRHTTEAMMNMLGKESKVHFYSGIDPDSFKKFSKNLDLDKTKFLVVSKSGGTLETTIAYQNAKKLMQDHLKKEDVSDRFVAMTDQSSEKSKLRQIVDKGEIKVSGLVHDDVGGRFSIFDDATIFTMAYAGVDKKDTEKMLKASLDSQKEFLNPDINKNEALKLAAFNVEAKTQGKKTHFVEYFGDAFSGATLWEKQMKNESLKSNISTDTNIGPGYLHYNAESDLDPNNKDSFYTFIYVKPQDKVTDALLSGAMKAYKAQHPVSVIEFKDLSPESIARFIELKHFETLYTGEMLRQKKGDITPQDKPLPEVVQPNVEIYKKEVKKIINY